MKVRFTEAARDDIANIHGFIARENPKGAAQMVAAIETSTMRLADFPLSGRRGAVNGTRELVISHLPFIAVYRVLDGYVEIAAVFHAAQDKPRGTP